MVWYNCLTFLFVIVFFFILCFIFSYFFLSIYFFVNYVRHCDYLVGEERSDCFDLLWLLFENCHGVFTLPLDVVCRLCSVIMASFILLLNLPLSRLPICGLLDVQIIFCYP